MQNCALIFNDCKTARGVNLISSSIPISRKTKINREFLIITVNADFKSRKLITIKINHNDVK